jgi:heme/copper-type cytochrome/quinol oxidase subunit 1
VQHRLGLAGMPYRHADLAASDRFTGATTVPSIWPFLLGAATLPLPSNVWSERTQSRLPAPCQPIQGDGCMST